MTFLIHHQVHDRDNVMHGGDGKKGWLVHIHSHKGISPNKEKSNIGRRDIQSDTKIIIRGDSLPPFGTLLG